MTTPPDPAAADPLLDPPHPAGAHGETDPPAQPAPPDPEGQKALEEHDEG